MSEDTSIKVLNSKSENSKGFKEELTFFDLTNIIIGSIVGADIYIASALTAGMIGPFSIIIWVVAGREVKRPVHLTRVLLQGVMRFTWQHLNRQVSFLLTP